MIDRIMYAIAAVIVLAVLVTTLDVACMMGLDMRLAEVPKKAAEIPTGLLSRQPKPTATAPVLGKATPTPKPVKATPTSRFVRAAPTPHLLTPTPKPVRATPTPIPPTPMPTQTPHPTAAPPTHTPVPKRTLYQVVEALAGDTIKVSRAGKTYLICYAGIDAPDPATMIGCRAVQANRRFVKGKTVYLERDASDADQSGCLLRHVFQENGILVSAKLVYFGYAQVRTDSPDTLYRDLLLQVQQEAKEAKFGLWNSGPVPSFLPAPTPTPLPPPTATPVPTPTPTEEFVSGVVIAGIRYETDDEYIEIENQGTAPQDMTGWKIQSYAYNPEGCEPYEGQVYPFPNRYILNAGASVRIHSGPDAYDSPPSDLAWDRRHIWNNNGDKAILWNDVDGVVDTYCYKECCP